MGSPSAEAASATDGTEPTIPNINFELVLEDSLLHNTPTAPAYSNVAIPTDNSISPGGLATTATAELHTTGLSRAGDTASANLGGTKVMRECELTELIDNYALQSEPRPRHKPPSVPAHSLLPTVHPRTTRKLQDWQIIVEKPVLILGDSNLARIPVFTDTRLQIDSFPGATCSHITALLRKLRMQPQVERVILSIGLNNCLREQSPATSWKQFMQLIATANTVFPMASIHVPLIHYSDKLPINQQDQIKDLNNKIRNKFDYLSRVERTDFAVKPRDPVHWTEDSADLILKNWLN